MPLRVWMRRWIETFSDTSVLWYPFPKGERELYEMIPYLKMAGIKEVAVTGEGDGPSPWMFVRFITEDDDPIVVAK